MSKKQQKQAVSKRKVISFPRNTTEADDAECCSASSMDENNIFIELFRIAEEEFGLPSSRPITQLSDAIFMEYVVSLIQRHAAKDVEKELLISLSTGRCLPSSFIQQEQITHNQQFAASKEN